MITLEKTEGLYIAKTIAKMYGYPSRGVRVGGWLASRARPAITYTCDPDCSKDERGWTKLQAPVEVKGETVDVTTPADVVEKLAADKTLDTKEKADVAKAIATPKEAEK